MKPLGASLAFLAPRPNPLSGATELGFDLPSAAPVELGIYDLGGRRVQVLASGSADAGRHRMRWDGTDQSGARVAAGIYFARFHTTGFDRTVRLVVLP